MIGALMCIAIICYLAYRGKRVIAAADARRRRYAGGSVRAELMDPTEDCTDE